MRPNNFTRSITLPIAAAAAVALAAPVASVHANSIDLGSLGSSDNKPKHWGKLGRKNAPNGVRSINTWVYAPTAKARGGAYPLGRQIGVKWNSVIESGDEILGKECNMTVRITGPRAPRPFKTKLCTSKHTWKINVRGAYTIRVTDSISGASNAVRLNVR
ncbi:hypothetical protein GOARA_056_00940 [Gordonia araii NBRC 100433]|uniref:Uncharacterized protein n=1 Tax=Gordonia araii NBRC 100433 TaxID=1073574 RepID=G7H3C2_9ACTN|nr:hypothetical protein [Gordonia araii]NNG96466.1 hypothetical protein [Gordonia araii NBRC 100433]GAB10347.1 hypothetical protein GOARA_056_00940 [Gordonia araii NBRC 100433]